MKLRILLAAMLALVGQALAEPTDVRVKPLLESRWGSGDVGGRPCYDLYTPVLESSGTNAPCGRIATTLAQLMHYHRYPEGPVEAKTESCDVDVRYYESMEDEEGKGKSRVSLSMQGEVYDWDMMPAVPDASMSDEERKAIGKLTSDVGIALRTAYDKAASYACVWRIPEVLKSVFGYANACFMGTNDEVDSSLASEYEQSTVQSRILANLDVGYPVLLDVRQVEKNKEHDISYMDVVIADGYGYDENGTLCLHVVDRKTAYWRAIDKFSNICGLYFNIFPKDLGTEKTAFSGRVVTSAGEVVAGAVVNIYPEGEADAVASLTTSESGVFGVLLPSGKKYEVAVLKDGLPVDRLGPYTLGTQQHFGSIEFEKWQYSVLGARDETIIIQRTGSAGSRWGDVALPTVAARIVSEGKSTAYGSVEAAVIGARALVKGGAAEVTIEVLRDLALSGGVTVDFPCVIARADDAADASVRILRSDNAAKLTVAKTGTLTIRDVSFASSNVNQHCTSAAVVVKDGGLLRLGSGVDFDMAAEHSAVQTAQANGLEVVAALTSAFAMQCTASLEAGGAFGVATCAADVAASSAALIENASDGEGSVRGSAVVQEDGTVQLVWSKVDVPITAAAGYFVDSAGTTRTAPRLDQALALIVTAIANGEVGSSPELVLRDVVGLTLTRLTTVSGSLTIRGETSGRLTISPSDPSAGFVVPEGASLRVQNLAFDGTSGGYNGNSMILVKGGSVAVENVAFLNLSGTNSCSPALAVMSGSATVSKSLFDGCRTSRNASGVGVVGPCGGGVYLGKGASLSLSDSAVTNCWASAYGGGIYASSGASVSLSGSVFVIGNATGGENNKGVENNITLLQGGANDASLKLTGAVSGAVGVRWRATDGAASRALAGGAFATADSAEALSGSAAAFQNDADSTLAAKADASSLSLVWEQTETGKREVPADSASVKVTPADGGRVRYYALVSDAADTLDGDATIELLQDCDLLGNATIAHAVTLKSSGSAVRTLSRTDSMCFSVVSGGSLTVSGLALSGGGKAGTLVNVAGGALTLQSGAVVTNVAASAKKAASAIYVSGGTFTMESGAIIAECRNSFHKESVGQAVGGGVRVANESVAWLNGGVITNCESCTGGGIAVTDRSTVYVSGGVRILGNVNTLTGEADDLLVSDNSTLYLSGPLTGAVGVSPGVAFDGVVFGRVASAFSGSAAEAANSAHRFAHDLTGDVGIAVKPASGSGETLLVWSDALDVDGTVEAEGKSYKLAAGGETLTAAVTDATTVFYYDGTSKTPEFSGHGFAVAATPQTLAGSYTATLTPKAGFAWAGGSTAAQTEDWTIRKSTYAMNLIKFSDTSFLYDGQSHSIKISGTLPNGVSVEYSGNERTEVGDYVVTAKFAGDYDNYEKIADMKAILKIYQPDDDDDSDDSQPSATTNSPTPIAFQSIERLGDGSWRLVVTNRVPWCWYRLLSTADLTKGFTMTNDWERAPADATPAWTNDVETTGEVLFWKAEGKEGEVGE